MLSQSGESATRSASPAGDGAKAVQRIDLPERTGMNAIPVRDAESSHPTARRHMADLRWRRLFAQLQKVRAWRKRIGLEKTLSGLEDFQLDDLGIARGEISAYARAAPSAPRLLSAMLEELGLTAGSVDPRSQVYGQLLKSCRICPNVATCERWLRTCEPPERYRAFCLNVARLDTLPRRSGKSDAPGRLLQSIMVR